MSELTDEQQAAMEAAMEALDETGEAVVVGPAGTGKTYMLKALIEETGREAVVLGAPTGKAALRQQQMTGHDAHTLHHLLYSGPDDEDETARGELVWTDPGPPCEPEQVLIVDESSMVGSELYGHIMEQLPEEAAVAWFGDHEQLSPVNDTWGPDLQDPTAELTTVHRQAAGSPVIQYATAIRKGHGSAWRSSWTSGKAARVNTDDTSVEITRSQVDAVVAWAVARSGADATVLTWTHRVRERIIGEVRRALGFSEPIEVGDRLCCKMNSRALKVCNGEVFTVAEVEPCKKLGMEARRVKLAELRRPVVVLLPLLNTRGREVWDLRKQVGFERWDKLGIMHAWHGQCLTVHSSQGSQWDEVAWAFGRSLKRAGREDRDFAKRLAYTAVTRAAKHLAVFDLT